MNPKRIGPQFKALGNIMKRYFENASSLKYAKSITGENTFILSYLAKKDKEPIYQKDIEKRFAITRSTTSNVLSLMEKKNLINRLPVANDKRLKQIVLTEDAKTLHADIVKEIEDFEATMRKGFSEEEVTLLMSFIDRIKTNLEVAQEDN
jgi:DNA-binding MarR family transcriptional regulator